MPPYALPRIGGTRVFLLYQVRDIIITSLISSKLYKLKTNSVAGGTEHAVQKQMVGLSTETSLCMCVLRQFVA